MNRRTLLIAATSAVVIASLVAIAAPVIVPFLPRQVEVALSGTIHTTPGTVDDLFAKTESGDSEVSHADVDKEYVIAASIWPWSLPPGWGFPRNRGVADTAGRHWDGMGVKAAFSTWVTASLEAVKAGNLTPDTANDLLDEVESAYQTLFDAGMLSDRSFIARSVTPLRP